MQKCRLCTRQSNWPLAPSSSGPSSDCQLQPLNLSPGFEEENALLRSPREPAFPHFHVNFALPASFHRLPHRPTAAPKNPQRFPGETQHSGRGKAPLPKGASPSATPFSTPPSRMLEPRPMCTSVPRFCTQQKCRLLAPIVRLPRMCHMCSLMVHHFEILTTFLIH